VDGPATGEGMIAEYADAFQAGTSPVDVFSNADDSGPAFYRSGWIEALDDVIPQQTWDDFPKIFNSQIESFHSYEGKRYRVPHEFSIGYFWYRKDWFDQQGIQAPKTWEEFIDIGKAYTRNGISGTLDALTRPALLFVYLAYITAQAGGNLFKFDEGTADAFQFVYDLIHTHKILPEESLSVDYTRQNEAYMQDRVAMMRQWPFFWGVSRDNMDDSTEKTLKTVSASDPKEAQRAPRVAQLNQKRSNKRNAGQLLIAFCPVLGCLFRFLGLFLLNQVAMYAPHITHGG
jgi:ABC-type glycerol-3-phosphate transport system substrate-binding protein